MSYTEKFRFREWYVTNLRLKLPRIYGQKIFSKTKVGGEIVFGL